MKKKRPYIKLWKSDFRDGSRMLSRPAKLLYFELIMLLDDHGGLIPDDPKWIAKHIGAHDVRVVRRPLDELIDAGKIQRTLLGLTNGRISRDLDEDDPSAGGGRQGAPPSTEAVQNPVDDGGDSVPLRADCASTEAPLRAHYPQSKPQVLENADVFRPPNHSHSHSHDHEVVVAVPFGSARARDGPMRRRA